MRRQDKCLLSAALTTCVVALASPSFAARLYLGLPNGTHVAYRRAPSDTVWTRETVSTRFSSRVMERSNVAVTRPMA